MLNSLYCKRKLLSWELVMGSKMAFCESRIKCKTNTSATIYFTEESVNFYEKSTFLVFLHSWSMKIIFAIEKALSKITSQNKLMLINLFYRQRPKCLNSFFLDSLMSRWLIRELGHICMCFWFWNRGWFSRELPECIFIIVFVVLTPNE